MMDVQTKIYKQTLINVDGRTNVISEIDWVVTIDDGTKVTHHGGKTELELPTDAFTEFQNLSDQQKLDWAFAPYGGLDVLMQRFAAIAEMQESGASEVTVQEPVVYRQVANSRV
jgi:L-ascorbate metabolism protein UlaG (beta-lactamase superfamily)